MIRISITRAAFKMVHPVSNPMDRDPFAEQVLALMRVAPKGCATNGQSIDWTPALAVRGTALRRIAA